LLKQHTQELAKQAEAEAKAKQKPAAKPARAARAAGLDGLQTVEGAMADASKLSLSELAVLGLNERGLDSGMSDQSEQARRVLKLKREAEGSRVSGDFGGAMAKSQEAYGIQQGLTALKESERDPYSGLKAALESARLNVAIDDAQLKTLTKGGTFQ
jgi:hypothetical protein